MTCVTWTILTLEIGYILGQQQHPDWLDHSNSAKRLLNGSRVWYEYIQNKMLMTKYAYTHKEFVFVNTVTYSILG